MFRTFLILCAGLSVFSTSAAAQAVVRVEPVNLPGSRTLPDQTRKAAIRDYLQSWTALNAAFEQNRADLLASAFAGSAKETLAATIRQQSALGISTRYQDLAHDIQIAFYSPEGLSIQLTDHVDYEIELLDHGRVKTTQRVRSNYVIVLTPAEASWKVRVFQGSPR